MLITPSLSHCSNKYKLAREGEKDKGNFYFLFFFRTSLGWSQVVPKEMSFQLLLEDWQGSSIPDRGGKIIPPSRNGEWECSGEWFWASLWWYHKASLTSRSHLLLSTKWAHFKFDACYRSQKSWHGATKGWKSKTFWKDSAGRTSSN